MKYYQADNPVGRLIGGVAFLPTGVVGGVMWGVHCTNDPAVIIELDSLVRTGVVYELTQEQYERFAEKKASTSPILNEPQQRLPELTLAHVAEPEGRRSEGNTQERAPEATVETRTLTRAQAVQVGELPPKPKGRVKKNEMGRVLPDSPQPPDS